MLALASGTAAAPPCEAPTGFTPRERLEGPGLVVLFRTEPAVIDVGQHFAVDAIVCASGSDVAGLRVNAQMPEHRHGMNYRPRVSRPAGAGYYRAEGLLFHMPGRWQLAFDVDRGGRTQRVTADIVLE
jgi:hypothetical protein